MGAAESALPETFAAVRGSTPKASGRMLQTQDVLFPLQPTMVASAPVPKPDSNTQQTYSASRNTHTELPHIHKWRPRDGRNEDFTK